MTDEIVKIDLASENVVEEPEKAPQPKKVKVKSDDVEALTKRLIELEEKLKTKEEPKEEWLDLTPKSININKNILQYNHDNIKPDSKELPIQQPIEIKKKSKINRLFWVIISGIWLFVCVAGGFLVNSAFKIKVIPAYSISFVLFTVLFLFFGYFIKPRKKSPIEKSQTSFADLEMSNMKRCPICDAKLIKGKIIENMDSLRQNIKCNNPECDFKKNIQFKK